MTDWGCRLDAVVNRTLGELTGQASQRKRQGQGPVWAARHLDIIHSMERVAQTDANWHPG